MMLEKHIERKGHDAAKRCQVMHLKFSSPQRASVPDRLLLAKIPDEHRDIVAKYIKFVEYKNRGKKPTAAQAREHERLRDYGFEVHVVDNVADSVELIESMSHLPEWMR